MRTIILDYPHGDNVAGKGSPDGKHKEYIWGREILPQVYKNLKDLYVPTVLSNPGMSEIGLLKRKAFMNTINAPAFVFSLHNNAAGMGDKWMNARGASIWTTKGLTKSDSFATYIYQELVKDIPEMSWRMDYTDKDVDYEENFTVLTSKHPSVLLEWGFQDNKEDLAIIEDPIIKDKLIHSLTSILLNISKWQ